MLHSIDNARDRGDRLMQLLQDTSANGKSRLEDEAFRLAFKMLQNADDAQDVVQSTYTSLIEGKIDQYDCSKEFRPWFMVIVANRCKDVWRDRLRRGYFNQVVETPDGEFDLSTIGSTELTPEGYLITIEEANLIRHAINRLTPERRDAIVLCYFGEMEYRQIASHVSASLGTVKSRLHRGKVELKDYLKQYFEELAA